jgi:hypothetical protein
MRPTSFLYIYILLSNPHIRHTNPKPKCLNLGKPSNKLAPQAAYCRAFYFIVFKNISYS